MIETTPTGIPTTFYTLARIHDIGEQLLRSLAPNYVSMRRTRSLLPRAQRWRLAR